MYLDSIYDLPQKVHLKIKMLYFIHLDRMLYINAYYGKPNIDNRYMKRIESIIDSLFGLLYLAMELIRPKRDSMQLVKESLFYPFSPSSHLLRLLSDPRVEIFSCFHFFRKGNVSRVINLYFCSTLNPFPSNFQSLVQTPRPPPPLLYLDDVLLLSEQYL